MKLVLMAIASALFALIILAGMAGAHEIWGPDFVLADPSGHFSYQIVVVISEPVKFGWLTFDGWDNTNVSMHMDGFCMAVVEPNTDIWTIEGELVDITKDGSVHFAQSMCSWMGELTTIISLQAVATENTTWGTIKSMYR